MIRVTLDKTELSEATCKTLKQLVDTIRSETPGQIQSRYISCINLHRGEMLNEIKETFWATKRPMVVQGLPEFSDIEDTKILLLLLGESIGKCAAYSEYNQSYITDIRPTKQSAEASSGTELLSMHNDLAFATDGCRPAALVLVPHIADNTVPKTLIATTEAIVSALPQDVIDILEQRIFEIRSGAKLLWPCEQIRRISIIDYDAYGVQRLRLNFNNVSPIPTLNPEEANLARHALDQAAQEALLIGRMEGHQILKGEALLIPNDYCLHGRDIYSGDCMDRLLLRSYIMTEEMVKLNHGNTMVSLRL
ncbi:TauD/TfdA family dioxygenase [Pseudovibrio sp. Tun.PSC04-5.I4]|uniref:TauD/TfdA family dioxygenase n=1 Tax=Pseudovibrio sp. Tun.PSC04-5.I4 TaxID=1798213 RepID=UPI00088AB9B8|nr:TauD/TfdA family dioxygenase [Pseudovibrio sp. Tun.PSC04-5.I4]SDR35208.1 hypothetical protein SAMN04515695_4831 [Pseudovibrio sp. Tun.PSC04-5.I4]